MILNDICWWDFCTDVLGNVEYPFIAIIRKFTLTWSGSTC